MSERIRVVSLTQTCSACPSQWSGHTDDRRAVYVRYRWGRLTVSVGAQDDFSEFAGVQGEEVFSAQLGDEYDGVLGFGELCEATQHVIDWSPRNPAIGERTQPDEVSERNG